MKSKTVLITGSSQNLGYTIAECFAEAGARVILHGSRPEKTKEVFARFNAKHQEAEHEAVSFNLGNPEEIKAALKGLLDKNICPNVLVNNAAHLGLGESGFLEQTQDFFREVIEVNLFGAFTCSQIITAEMVKRGMSGSVIHISSLAGERTIPNRSAYSVSKAALDGLTRSMAVELAPRNIRVNGVVAGYVWTTRWDALAPEVVDRRHKNIPVGKPTQQDEIAKAVLFLASDAAPTLTGARIVMDGGFGIQQAPVDVYV